ncbi:hypothetical protein, partial [Shouchella clausii]
VELGYFDLIGHKPSSPLVVSSFRLKKWLFIPFYFKTTVRNRLEKVNHFSPSRQKALHSSYFLQKR